jgi:hypothetical protein
MKWRGDDAVIRQAISCDICGTEKRQTNHWFVACDLGGELRVSGWKSRNRLRPGTKHLCGQTCLHKLVDEFMARDLAARDRVQPGAADEIEVELPAEATDASLISKAAYAEVESSARLVAQAAPLMPQRVPVRAGLVAVQGRVAAEERQVPLAEESPRFASRKWRAEAWEREREREMRAVDRRPDIAAWRRSGS